MQTSTKIDTLTTTDPAENEWKRLFVITEHWRSDVTFFSDELQFLKGLMDKYFMTLIKEQNIDTTKATVHKLTKLENKRNNFEQKMDRHFNHIISLVENPFPHDAQVYRDEHAKLALAMADFEKDFRELKKEIFQLAKEIINTEKSRHLLSS
jgi:cysteinyl-tRNA synthetase